MPPCCLPGPGYAAARFFRPSSYCVALTLAQMPVVLADVICCAGFFYWYMQAHPLTHAGYASSTSVGMLLWHSDGRTDS